MKERIEKIIDKEQLTPSKLADLVGVQRSSISHILSGRNNPSLDFIQKILLQFKNINSDWLLFGKGEMYKTKEPTLFDQQTVVQKTIPENNTIDISKQQNQESPKITKENNVKVVTEEKENKADKVYETKIKTDKKIETNSGSEIQSFDISQPEQVVIFFSDKTFSSYRPK